MSRRDKKKSNRKRENVGRHEENNFREQVEPGKTHDKNIRWALNQEDMSAVSQNLEEEKRNYRNFVMRKCDITKLLRNRQ